MRSEIKVGTLKANLAPGTPIYTGSNTAVPPRIRVVQYSPQGYQEKTGTHIEECQMSPEEGAITWVHVEGLQDVDLMEQLANQYNLHPLTLEDILNVEQRPKIEEFDHYIFITLKALRLTGDHQAFTAKNLSIVIGKNFVLLFQDEQSTLFEQIHKRIVQHPDRWLNNKGSDYLGYRLIDTIVDQYFFVLEEIGDQIEEIENLIIIDPTKRIPRLLYHLKNQMLQIRKVIWPLREVLNHLMNAEEDLITHATRVYVRDVLDHASQAIDVVETFRDMLSNLMDVYLSSLSSRMNEIMKVLTIIATIFIPITFITSLFGMNFTYMPELHWKWSYPIVLFSMALIAGLMLYYYRRKKWL